MRVARGMAGMLLALAGTAANAQETIYIGLGAGLLDYSEGTSDPLLGEISDNVLSLKLIGGFEFSEHFAMEINYGEMNQIRDGGSGNIPPLGDVSESITLDIKTSTLRALGQLPLDWAVLIGSLGYFNADTGFSETLITECCGTLSNAGSFNDDGMTASLGLEWRFGRFGTSYGVRIEYEWWDIEGVDMASTGVVFTYRF